MNTDEDLDVSRTEYDKGYTLYGFSQATEHDQVFEVSKRGSVRIDLKFDVARAHFQRHRVRQMRTRNRLIPLATYCSITQTKMNTEQIEQLCRSDQVMSPKFGGGFSRDNLPDLAEDAKFYVCNTDPSSEPGDHWVVLLAAA